MKIIIAGSLSAADEIIKIKDKLVARGDEVEYPTGVKKYEASEHKMPSDEEKAQDKIDYDLIRGYFEKIKNYDALLVVNPEKNGVPGYIGGNTLIEMAFAFVLRKPIYLLHQIPKMPYTSEIEALMPIVLDGNLSKLK
ncbi:MAG: hypothetical protein AAB483_00575 [Patescibacteria group bacterium]